MFNNDHVSSYVALGAFSIWKKEENHTEMDHGSERRMGVEGFWVKGCRGEGIRVVGCRFGVSWRGAVSYRAAIPNWFPKWNQRETEVYKHWVCQFKLLPAMTHAIPTAPGITFLEFIVFFGKFLLIVPSAGDCI